MQEFLPIESRPDCQKTALTRFVFVLNLFTVLQRVSNGYFKENYNFPRFQRGSNIYQGGGVQLFQGDPKANFYRNGYISLGTSSKLPLIVEWHFAGERMLAQFYMLSSLLVTDRRISLQINETNTDILFNSSSDE